jgi:nicotinamide mononucleotide (NMN) deamidase PncC
MDPRTTRIAAAVLVALCVLLLRPPPASGAGASPWTRPVAGPVVRPFVAPRSRYGAGHRGADLAAAPGTPVLAAGAGRVVFAGSVAGTLHVVVDHGDGLRTSASFLATVAVRAGQTVAAGAVVGTVGGSGPDHAVGVVHIGLRVDGDYVDPMQLFAPVDLAKAVHLAPVRHRSAQTGLETPSVEARELAASLHIPQRLPGLEPPPAPGIWDRATNALGAAVGAVVTVGSIAGRPLVATWRTIAAATPLGDAAEDLGSMASRIAAYVRSRDGCTARADAGPGPSGGGSGHLAFAVGGIDSATDPRTGATFGLDWRALGYRTGEVGWFSYRAGGGPYRASDTWSDLVAQARSLGDQLRAFAVANPGREVDLIAHSQGGVVLDAFLELEYDPADPTLPPLGTVVTLSSPHQGAPLAQVATDVRASPRGRGLLDGVEQLAGGAIPPSGGRSTRQLDPRSPLMHRLRVRSLPEQIGMTSVSGTDDPLVPS